MRTANCPLTVAGAATGNLNASFNSDPFRVENMTWAAIQAVVSGSAALNGTLKIQASCDLGVDTNAGPAGIAGISNWVDITGTTQAIAADGANMFNLQDMGFRWFRLVYTRTAGTGTLSIIVNAKGFS